MDKETLSNYGWVVIAVLVLSVMIALATPFGKYIGNAVKSTTEGLFKVQQKALGAAGLIIGDQSFEYNGGGSTPEPPAPVPVVAGATFKDGTFLTWEELKLAENGTKYEYDASKITDTSIGYDAFCSCTSLTSIDLPESLTTIGEWAFSDCTSLTSIDLPESLTTIGELAFINCISLPTINVDTNNQNYCSVDGVLYSKDMKTLICYPTGKTGTSYTIPDSITTIGTCAFINCTSLTSIDLSGCTSLTTIGEWAFYSCTSLTSIDLPESLTTIGEWAFYECTSLTSIDLSGCTSLTTIGEGAFRYCTSLTSIDLPESLTTIGELAFYECTSLTSIDLPESLTSIGEEAFSDCTSLININYAGSMEDWGNITLGDYWNYNSSITEIVCSDGTITL